MSKWWINWPGKNDIYCNGRLISGPDKKTFAVSNALIIIPIGVFFGLTAPYLWIVNPIMPILTAILLVFSIGSLWIAGMMDPGIIPRGRIGTVDVEEVTSDDPLAPFAPMPKPPSVQEVEINGIVVRMKYCGKSLLQLIYVYLGPDAVFFRYLPRVPSAACFPLQSVR